jgi:hypothetical protein
VFGAAVAVCLAQVTPAGHGLYRLQAKRSLGSVTRYTSTLFVRDAAVRSEVVAKVVKLHAGIATLNITIGAAINAKTKEPLGLPKKNVVRLDAHNQPVGNSGVPNIVAQFPTKPVRIGGVWTGLSTFPSGMGAGGVLVTTYRLSAIQKDGRRRIAVLDVLVRGMAKGTGALLIDAADGSVLASTLSLQVSAAPGTTDSIQLKIKRHA